jgi:GTP-binding protein
MPLIPSIAVVGRPNVGKSTLVNLLSGRTVSVVADTPAVTRDRVVAEIRVGERAAHVIDTGGFMIRPEDNVAALVMEQLAVAIEESDVIVCLFDASEPPTLLDEEIVRFLRKQGRPTLYAANKTDRKRSDEGIVEYHALGIDEILPVSAAHNTGVDELRDRIEKMLPPPAEAAAGDTDRDARILLLGRPNSGKSTLINTVLGKERVIVDPRPGTTRDCIAVEAEIMGSRVILIDSAGIRRPRSVHHYMEEMSVIRAIRQIDVADVAILLIDAPGGMVQQDERLASMVVRKGKGLVVALNKWDLMKQTKYEDYVARIRPLGDYLKFVPAVPLSGLTGWNVEDLLSAVLEVKTQLGMRIPTSQLNKFLEEIVAHHPPPRSGGRRVRIYYVTQTGTNPPRFTFITNRPDDVAENWKRYAASQIREAFGFIGVPLRLQFRPRR